LIDQSLSGLAQPPRQGAQRPSQACSGIGLSNAFQFAKNECRPLRIGQILNFLMNRSHE
jgi:hypothetical protein